MRDRAVAVEAARAELVEAERALADHAAEIAAAEAASAAAEARAADAADDASEEGTGSSAPRGHRHGPPPAVRRSRSLGALVASFGLVLLALGFHLLPLWAALLFPLAASLWAMRYLRAAPR